MVIIPTYIAPSLIHGFGCFAGKNINKGEMIWIFIKGFDKGNPLDDCDFRDNARFINHSYDPNIAPDVNGNMFALRDIYSGEEITENYRHSIPELLKESQEFAK